MMFHLWNPKTVADKGGAKVPLTASCTKNVSQVDTPNIKIPANKFVIFKSILNDIKHEAVILKTVEHEKAKSEATRYIHIVSVFKRDGKKIIPYLKWINKSYCSPITEERDINNIPSHYFDYDWMVNDEETKRVKRISSKVSLQEKDGGTIRD
jgi:hypothetical protein